MKIKGLLASLALVFASTTASAGVITSTDSIDSSTEVDFFTIVTDGTNNLEINVFAANDNGSNLDAYIYLFESDLTGALLGFNDDTVLTSGNGAAAIADGTVHEHDSYLNMELTAGTYVLAIGDYELSEAEARSGFNSYNTYNGLGDYKLTFSGDSLVSVTNNNASVPVTPSFALFSLALLSMGCLRKKKFK